MKKTVTTILSLAMAIIMVSSLASGVILAKGNKIKYRTITVREVAILECVSAPGTVGIVSFFDGPDDIMLPMEASDETCRASLDFLVNKNFEIEDVGTFLPGAGVLFERYTLTGKKRVRVPRNNHGDDDDDDDDDN